MLKVRLAKPGDGFSLAPRLRPADLAELRASMGPQPAAVLLELSIPGNTYVAVDEHDAPQVFFGAGDPECGAVAIYMVAAVGIERHAKQILQDAPHWIDVILQGNTGHNYVDSRNTLHIRWLKRLGAVFTGAHRTFADPEVPFLKFYILPCATPSLALPLQASA